MTLEDKITYFRIAANIANIGINDQHADVLVNAYEAVLTKGGELTLRDVTDIEWAAKERADAKSRSALLDKVSKKI